MSTRWVGRKLAPYKERKREQKKQLGSDESDLDEIGFLDDEMDPSSNTVPLSNEFKCQLHSSYKLIDLDIPQDEGEVKEEKVKIKFRNVRSTDTAFLPKCFNRLKNVKFICIEVAKINLFFCHDLKEFLDKSPLLHSLCIYGQQIDDSRCLTEIFTTYSSLEEVFVKIKDQRNLNDIDHSIKLYLNRIAQVRKIIAEAKSYLSNLFVLESSAKKEKKIEDDEEYLIKLALVYEKSWQACSHGFIGLQTFFEFVTNGDKNLIEQLNKARDYHPLIAVQNGALNRLKRIFAVRTEWGLPINALYVGYQLTPCRLIDLANKSEIVKYLVNERKAEAVTFEDYEYGVQNDHWADTCRNLLVKIMGGKLSGIKPIDLQSSNSYIDIVYDAVAYAIVHSLERVFEEIQKEYTVEIDINKPLEQGMYIGYTIFQLFCFHYDKLKKRNIILNYIQDEFKKIPSEKRQIILDSRFPNKTRYEKYAGLTMWQYLTYHLYLSLLLQIMPEKVDFSQSRTIVVDRHSKFNYHNNYHEYHLLQLFIQSVLDRQDDLSDTDKEKLPKCYDLLRQDDTLDFKNLQLRDNQRALPVFCYAAKNSKTQLSINFSMQVLFKDFFSIDNRFNCLDFNHITLFHASLLFGGDAFCKSLMQTLLQAEKIDPTPILRLLSERIDHQCEYQACTYFQMVALRQLAGFISTLPRFIHSCQGDVNSLVNMPYPSIHSDYAGWTPIQVAIQLAKRGLDKGYLFDSLTEIKGIDLAVCYPNNVYLTGLSVLQAILVSDKHDPGKSSVAGGNFGVTFIKKLMSKLTSDQVNYVCQERNSTFYGMTALHIAVNEQKEENVKELLSWDKIDYTVVDFCQRAPLAVASYLRNHNITRFLDEGIRKFPQHHQRLKFHSEVCPSLDIKQDRWVISIARENNSNHAFLIFEGLEQEEKQQNMKAIVWVAQLYLPRTSNSALGQARVDIEYAEEKLEMGRGKTQHLLSSVRNKLKPLIQLSPGTMLFYDSAYVESKECHLLIKKIQEEKTKSFSYSIVARILSSGQVYDCVKWAMERYNSVVPVINKLPDSWKDNLFTVAKGFLNEQFNYVADASASHDLLTSEVSRLSNENKRLTSENKRNHNSLLFHRNIHGALLASIVCMLLCNAAEYPSNTFFRLLLSMASGCMIFGISSFSSRPKEREYNEEPDRRNRLS